jgi:hypothetical protein
MEHMAMQHHCRSSTYLDDLDARFVYPLMFTAGLHGFSAIPASRTNHDRNGSVSNRDNRVMPLTAAI